MGHLKVYSLLNKVQIFRLIWMATLVKMLKIVFCLYTDSCLWYAECANGDCVSFWRCKCTSGKDFINTVLVVKYKSFYIFLKLLKFCYEYKFVKHLTAKHGNILSMQFFNILYWNKHYTLNKNPIRPSPPPNTKYILWHISMLQQ